MDLHVQAQPTCKINFWMQEGVASEADRPLMARIYFMAFYVVTLVIVQVFITYIVDEFKFKLKESVDECQKHNRPYEHCLCTRERHLTI